MKPSLRSLSIVALLASGACAVDEEELPQLEGEAATTSTLCEGGRILASLRSPYGTTVDFCSFAADQLYGIRESGPLDARSYLATLPATACADDIHLALAPDKPIPPELIEACLDKSGTTSLELDEPLDPDTDGEFGKPPVEYSHYCSGDGDVEFAEERCPWAEDSADGPWYASTWWCISDSWTSVQKTATTQLGTRVDFMGAVVASCSGTTDAKLKAKVGGSWNTYVHDTVSGNYWASWELWTNGSIDFDMRFNAVSDDGYFRNAGYFYDVIWP